MKSILTLLVRLLEARHVSKFTVYERSQAGATGVATLEPLYAALARMARVARQRANQVDGHYST